MTSLRYIIDDLKYVAESLEFMEVEELKETKEDLERIKDTVEIVLGEVEGELRRKLATLTPEKVKKEYRIEYPELEEATGMKQLTAHELITVAIAQKPKAPERVKREAEKIIEKYGLTEEEIKRIYEFIFGS